MRTVLAVATLAKCYQAFGYREAIESEAAAVMSNTNNATEVLDGEVVEIEPEALKKIEESGLEPRMALIGG